MGRTVKSPLQSARLLLSDERGVVFAEFLIAFVPVWVFFLCGVQLAFIAHANLMVKHSADAAARSAVVVLPDDPNEYAGEPEMSVGRNSMTASDIMSALGGVAAVLRNGPSAEALVSAFSEEAVLNLGRSRLNTIRLAAHIPLMPLAPANIGRDSKPSLFKAIGGEGKLVSAFHYQPFAVAVTFPGLQGDFVTEPEVTVRVTYAYQCTVPLARRILCQAFRNLQAKEELRQALLPLAQSFVGGHFRQLQHDTTLMIHDAPYEYRAQGS